MLVTLSREKNTRFSLLPLVEPVNNLLEEKRGKKKAQGSYISWLRVHSCRVSRVRPQNSSKEWKTPQMATTGDSETAWPSLQVRIKELFQRLRQGYR